MPMTGKTKPASSVNSSSSSIPVQALVVGAGPVGLFQVFELGLLGITAHVIDALPTPGGQCMALYPDKPIYDIPGTPVCTGRELVERLLKQIAPFKPSFHLHQQVTQVQPLEGGQFEVQTSSGTRFLTPTMVIAAGVGAFQPRRLALDGLVAFEGTQVFYSPPDISQSIHQHVVIVGDGDAALECAIHLAQLDETQAPSCITLIHRRDEFKAQPNTLQTFTQLRAAGRLNFVAAQATAIQQQGGCITALQLLAADGGTPTLPLDQLVVLMGLSPKLGPIAEWGLAMERKQLVVGTAQFETSTPGIFAVGDVNTYPGKKKLILCGFHEATLAAYGVAERVFPGQPIQLEYTTTSPRLHRLLAGV
jgi:thioredoxin reductase (NADPH)